MRAEESLARAVDRARWVRYHEPTWRLLVWSTGEQIDVVNVRTGVVVGNWLCDGTIESAAAVIEERLNAGY